MFWKKSQPDQPTQSQSISGTQINNAQVQMSQTGKDATATQSGNLAAQQQGLTGAEVVKLLEELETAVKASGLNADQVEEMLDYLKPAKREAAKEEADKNLVAQNLKKVGETLETANKVTDAGKTLWQKGQEIFTTIAPWLGGAAKLLGF